MGAGVSTLDCAAHTTREINSWLKTAARGVAQMRDTMQVDEATSDAHLAQDELPVASSGEADVVLLNPDSRHNLAVGIVTPLRVRIEGPVGYYCAGLCDGIDVRISGGAGWGLAENLMGGRVWLRDSAGSSAGATMRGGELFIGGDAGARCAVAMKGGVMVVGGDVGIMTGFMMQKGVLIVGGDAGEALGDSLYEGKIYVRGAIESLGSDAHIVEMSEDDAQMLIRVLECCEISSLSGAKPTDFKKVESAKRLYNFNTKEKEIWKSAL